MTNRYTDQEWEIIIRETERDIVIPDGPSEIPAFRDPAFNKTVDHTLLKLDAKAVQIDELCAQARENGFATVCVRPNFVERCVSNLKGSDVQVASVIGFHEGTYDTYHKLQESKLSILAGAAELDVVLNWPWLKESQHTAIYTELASLRESSPPPTKLKLILETSQLTRGEIVAACTLAAAAEFDFVKTSTGFMGHGAREEDVRLMTACCEHLAVGIRKKMQVKASGGIRVLDDAVNMLRAGATRLGTSGGVWIAKEAKEAGKAGKKVDDFGNGKGERPTLTTRLFSDY